MFEVIKHMCLCKYEIQMTNFGFKLKCPILNTFVYFTNTSVHLQTKKVQPSNTELKNTPRVQSLGPLMRRPAMGVFDTVRKFVKRALSCHYHLQLLDHSAPF